MSYEIFGVQEIKATRVKRYDGDGNEFWIIQLNIKTAEPEQLDKIRLYSNDKLDIETVDRWEDNLELKYKSNRSIT